VELTKFVLARLAEDEAGEVEYTDIFLASRAEPFKTRVKRVTPGKRWLANVEAVRRIVALHQAHHDASGWWCGTCDHDRDYGYVSGPQQGCDTLRALATIWRDHPSYDPAWAAD
jgi:hypothetical protein